MRLILEKIEFIGDAGDAVYTIALNGLKGVVESGADTQGDRAQRLAAHGSFAEPGYLTGALLSWQGEILTDSEQEQEHAIRRLSAVLNDGKLHKLTVDGEWNMWTMVRRSSPPDVKILVPGSVASYRFEAWAPDPRMYGEVRSFTAGTPAVNFGTFDADPVIEVSGPHSAPYTVSTGSGQSITISQALAAGEKHRLEMSTGRLYRNGVLQVGAITSGGTWQIPPGPAGVTHAITGQQTLSVLVTDTYA